MMWLNFIAPRRRLLILGDDSFLGLDLDPVARALQAVHDDLSLGVTPFRITRSPSIIGPSSTGFVATVPSSATTNTKRFD